VNHVRLHSDGRIELLQQSATDTTIKMSEKAKREAALAALEAMPSDGPTDPKQLRYGTKLVADRVRKGASVHEAVASLRGVETDDDSFGEHDRATISSIIRKGLKPAGVRYSYLWDLDAHLPRHLMADYIDQIAREIDCATDAERERFIELARIGPRNLRMPDYDEYLRLMERLPASVATELFSEAQKTQ